MQRRENSNFQRQVQIKRQLERMKNSSQKLLLSSLHSNASIEASMQEGYLTHQQLEECIKNYRKFHNTLNRINNGAIKCIYEGFYEDALIKLKEAQRILNFAVREGKNINQALIITVMHNEACAYQGVYNLPELSKHLETLLSHIYHSLHNTMTQQSLDTTQYLNRSFSSREVLGDYVKMKCRYGLYLLQYSGICSKNYEHELAIRYAQQSIRSIKRVCALCARYEKDQDQEYEKIWEINLLEELSNVKTKLKSHKYQKYLEIVRKLVKKGLVEQFQHKQIQLFVSEFTLHKILHLTPITLQESQSLPSLEQECTPVAKIKKIFYLSAAYFTIGTQLRLIASHSKNSLLHSSNEFFLSELYHLFSILLVLKWGRWKSVFIEHLLKSYSNHYGVNLQKDEEVWQPLIQSIKIHKFKLYDNESDSEDYAFNSDPEDEEEISGTDLVLLPRSSIKTDGQSKWSNRIYEKRNVCNQTNESFSEDLRTHQQLKTSPNVVINKKKVTPEQQISMNGLINDVALIESRKPFSCQKQCTKLRRKSSGQRKKSISEKKNLQIRKQKKKEKEGVYINDLIGTKRRTEQKIKSKSKDYVPRIMISTKKCILSQKNQGKSEEEKKEFYLLRNKKRNKQNMAINGNIDFSKEKAEHDPIMKNKSKEKKQTEKKKLKRLGK